MLARSHAPRSPRLAAAPADRSPAAFAPYGNAALAEQIGSPEAAFDESLAGSARALPFLDEMEGAFGADLGGVKAHLGAGGLPDALGARAAASGDTVAFASASPDREQVAHEVAHVLQAREGSGAGASAPGDASESQAHGAARAVAAGRAPGPLSRTAAAVHGDWIDDACGWVDETVDSVCGGEEEAVSSEAPPPEAATSDAGSYDADASGYDQGGYSEEPAAASEDGGFMDWVDEMLSEDPAAAAEEEACSEDDGFLGWVDEMLAEDEVAAEQPPAEEEEGLLDWLGEKFGTGSGQVDLKKPGEEESKNEASFNYDDGALEATVSRTVLKEKFAGPSFENSFDTQIAPGVVGTMGAKAEVGLELAGKVGVENGMDTTPPAPTNDGYWLQTASVFGQASITGSAEGSVWLGAGPGVANIVSVTGNIVGKITASLGGTVTLKGTMQRYVNLDEGRADPWSGGVSAQLDVPLELSAGLSGAIKYKVLMIDGTAYEMTIGKYSLATGKVTGQVSAGIPDGVVSSVGTNDLEWNKLESFPAIHLGTEYGGGGGSGAPAEGYDEEPEADGAGGGAAG